MKKIISAIFALQILVLPMSAFAQTTTLLPESEELLGECQGLITGGDTGLESKYYPDSRAICLAEKIQTGKIHYQDIPYFIGHIIKFLLSVGWALAVVMIIIGGYQYVLAGFNSGDKEKGKKTLIYAISGMAVATFAWFMVDTFIAFLTS